ncbi:Actin cross-linking toxin VgrG1 [compost metagenome]
MLEAEDQCTVSADRKVELKANDYLQIADSSHTRVGQTLVIESGQQVHPKAGREVILDAGASISLKGGGQHIVLGPGGIFSSTEIQIGGAPIAGTAAAPELPGRLKGLSIPAPLEAVSQTKALMLVEPWCEICEQAAQEATQ